MVSPGGKPFSALITRQNCTTCSAEERKLGDPKAFTVHARAGLVLASEPQLMSFSAFATAWDRPKSGGSKAGTPPPSHTPGPPSPSGREVSTCTSGRAVGSFGFQSNTTIPTGAPSLPGTASITNWNPEPAARWKTAVPSGAGPTLEMTVPSAAARPNTAIAGPWRGVGVGAGGVSSCCSNATTSAALGTASPLGSPTAQPPPRAPASSPNNCAATAASCDSAPLSHCTSA